MLDFASAVKRSADFRSKLAVLERAAMAAPDDRGLRITLASAKRSAERAERELFEIAADADVDLCRYRVAKSDEQTFAVGSFAKSLTTYQDLFTAVYDCIKNGPRLTASYANEVRRNSSLCVGYTYPGSLGVLLTIAASSRDLFGDRDLDRVVEKFGRLSQIDSIGDVKELATDLGLNVVRRTATWAKQNWDAGYSVDIQWRHSNAVVKGEVIARDQFLRIQSLIEQTSDVTLDEFDIVGTLGSYSILSDSFAILTSNDQTYRGKLHDAFVRREYKIPAQYRARIQVERSTKYASDSVSEDYFLLSLDEV